MARPARATDNDLAARIDALVAEAGSLRQAAIALHLDPSTLSRSLKQRAFGRTTRNQILTRLDEANTLVRQRGPVRKGRKPRPENRSDALHILHKLYKLLPDAIAALEAASGSALIEVIGKETKQ